MPGLAQTRAAVDRLREENEKLRRQLAEGGGDSQLALQRELEEARDRAEAAENRASDLENALRAAEQRLARSGVSDTSESEPEPPPPTPPTVLEETSGLTGSGEPQVTQSYENWSAQQLREELNRRKLPTSGTKPQLLERLLAHVGAPPEDA